MLKVNKYFLWFYMLTKRLLKEWGFVILLCLIPFSLLLTNVAMQGESGVVHIMLCSQNNDPTAAKTINTLMSDDSIIRFSLCDSVDDATKAVVSHNADAAWIFTSDFSEKLEKYISHPGSEDPFIEIIERESSIPLTIAREKLFGAIYGDFSYSIYKNFIYSELVSEKSVSHDIVQNYYQSMEKTNSIIKIERLDAKPISNNNNSNYLAAPMRGILSLMIVLCTLTATLYFLKEQSQGKYAWLPAKKRIIPALASCFSAALLSAIAVFITMQFIGISTNSLNEIISMLLFVISITGFCTTLSTFFRSTGKFGAIIPGLIIVMLVLSPIFFNLKILKPIRLMLPTHYYLHSIYNAKYYLYTVIYCIATYSVGFILNLLFAERKSFESVI